MSENYTINDLRGDLAATIRALRDKENPMAIDRAKAIADVAQTIINSAKVEVDMINAVGTRVMSPSRFLAAPRPDTLERQKAQETPAPDKGPRAPPRAPLIGSL